MCCGEFTFPLRAPFLCQRMNKRWKNLIALVFKNQEGNLQNSMETLLFQAIFQKDLNFQRFLRISRYGANPEALVQTSSWRKTSFSSHAHFNDVLTTELLKTFLFQKRFGVYTIVRLKMPTDELVCDLFSCLIVSVYECWYFVCWSS